MNRMEQARRIADAVLYEGYLLYPYRPSALKNQFRWQFGVVAPKPWSLAGGDPWEMQTECLIEPHDAPAVSVTIRFLQVEVDSSGAATVEKGVERAIESGLLPLASLSGERVTPFLIPAREGPIAGFTRLSAETVDGFCRLRLRIENLTDLAPESDRTFAMRRSLVGVHALLSVTRGDFVSLTDPPPRAIAAARDCSNRNTWPVLVGAPGDRDMMLSSPIILEDYPAVAPESPGDFFDATEMDEMLTLRVMTLTDEEKLEASAADDRARRIVERSASIPCEMFERLHGAIREMHPVTDEEFFNPPGEDPEHSTVETARGRIAKGVRVRLAPSRRSDSMDLFLAGRAARVQAVHRDLDARVSVAVTVEGDPAADLAGHYGRYYYFDPDELELMEEEP
jgi:hypothetical protein